MSAQLVQYRCPHCRRRIALDEEEIGTEIRCPYSDCQQTLRVEPPVEPLFAGETGFAERTLRLVHPAMFRVHPFAALLMAAATGAGLAGLWRWRTVETGAPAGAWDASTLLAASLVLAGGSAAGWFAWWVATRCTSLRVTTERSRLRTGLLSRSTSEVCHRDVRNLQVNQTLYQRLAGIGDLSISSAGQEDIEISVHGIPHPDVIAGIIRDRQ